MILTVVRRVGYALLLLGLISLLAFALSSKVPGDVVLDYLSIDDPRFSSSADPLELRQSYTAVASRRGLNLPLFYFSVRPGYFPDSLFSIVPVSDRKTVKAWTVHSRDGEASMVLYKGICRSIAASCPLSATNAVADTLCQQLGALLEIDHPAVVHERLQQSWRLSKDRAMAIASDLENLLSVSTQLAEGRGLPDHQAWIPAFQWHGTSCQYHQWMSGLITFRPLTSLVDGRNAWKKVKEALSWTLWLNGLAFLLAIGLGMWIGIWSGQNNGTKAEKVVQVLLFALFAIPSFWLATLLIAFFSTMLGILPAGGLGPYQTSAGFLSKWAILSRHLTLPVTCLAVGSLAYVSRQMKQSVLLQYKQPYVLALRTMGIRDKTVLWRHVVPNALFPMITMIGGALPALLSGSLIIEVIFSIPGMGRLMYTSLLARDWPVVFPLLMLAATITVLAYILTDIVYAWADPRVKSARA